MIQGEAAGMPFVAVEPAGGVRADAPVVVAWHLLGAPWTERAMAAALPLAGPDAWRFYLGLPRAGTRMPGGSLDEFMRVTYAEPVGLVDDAPLGLLGGSAGGGVAAEVTARADDGAVAALVLVNPALRLRPVVDALGRQFGVDYRWTAESEPVADRIDYVARAAELGHTPVRVIIGEDDDVPAFRTPASELATALSGPSDVVLVERMGHTLADAPGFEPAPQTPQAAEVDAVAVDWFGTHLDGGKR